MLGDEVGTSGELYLWDDSSPEERGVSCRHVTFLPFDKITT